MYAYTPRRKSYQQLETSFVGAERHDILKSMLEELNLKKGESPKQHWMIVGPRGMGKSHLLTLLYHRIKEDKKLAKRWLSILFPEEIRMAGNLSRFLERALQEIEIELSPENPEVAAELKPKIQQIRSLKHDERIDYLLSVLTWVHNRTGKYLLLIIENLQFLLGKRISVIEQKKLRAYLQSESAMLLFGSATTIFDALHDHSHPFYHFFHIRRLNDLSFEEIKELITNLLTEKSTEERKRIVMENEPRLRTLYAFTGGNPRMAVFLSDILKTDVNEEMIGIMDRILDELTPYFEAIINDTPDYIQDIVNTLAAYEPAQSPREIAAHLEVEQTNIRNYLKHAKDSGYVRVAFSKGRSNYYCLTEYLYRIWFQMRDSGHREQMRWLMELMLLLYSRDHIAEEKERIDLLGAREGGYYHQLVRQTFDFMSSNPDFCKIIDICVQQNEIESKPGKFIDSLRIRVNELQGKFAPLFSGERKPYGPTNRKLFSAFRLMYIDWLKEADLPEIWLRFYPYGLGLYFRGTFDIATAIEDYNQYISPLLNRKNTMHIDNMIHSKKNTDSTLMERAQLFMIKDNYNKAADLISKIDNQHYLVIIISFIAIQIVNFAINNNYEKLTEAKNALDKIGLNNKSIGPIEADWDLAMAFFAAYSQELISEETMVKFIYSVDNKSTLYLIMAPVWVCMKDPDSEAAQRIMAEPPFAALVSKVNDLVAGIEKPAKMRSK